MSHVAGASGARTRLYQGTVIVCLLMIAGMTWRAPDNPSSPARTVAIGDVHGAADALAAILQRTQLIDASHKWIGGAATLVQTGDVTDRGPKVREALDLLMSLEAQAPAAGGRVLALLGNHETMNLMGEPKYVTPEIYLTFADDRAEARRQEAFDAYVKLCKSRAGLANGVPPEIYRAPDRDVWMAAHPLGYFEYREAFSPDGRYGHWLRTLLAIAEVGETLFLHGGISAAYASQDIDALNKQIQKEIKAFDEGRAFLVKEKLALPWFTLQETLLAARAELERLNALATQSSNGDSIRQDGLGPLDARRLQTLQSLLRINEWTGVKSDGPLWYRGYAMWTPEEGAQQIQPILKKLGVAHIVVGHTPPMTMRITPRFRASVFLIDTGMLASSYPGGRASALDIQDGTYTAIYQEDSKILLQRGAEPSPDGY